MEVRQIEPIDRAELRATIQKWIDAHTDVDDTDGVGLLEDVLWEINAQPTLTPPNEWVSVEERLPTDERPVLVFVGYADTMTGFITTSSYFCFDANPHWQWDGLVRDEQRTLFWMPLPAPPKKEHDHEQKTSIATC